MAINEDWVCIIKLYLPQCPLTHAEGACASTSAQACFNTYATCNDLCSHQCGQQEVVFSTCELPAHFGLSSFPVLDADSMQRSAAKPTPGRSFSNRKYLQVTLKDAPTNGLGIDPYFPRVIPIVPPDQSPGSLLGRLEKIHKNFSGYKAEVLTGYCSQHISELRRETLMIDSFTGTPDKCTGTYSLKLVDVLALAGDTKCPETTQCRAASLALGNEPLVTPTLGIELDDEDPYAVGDSPLLTYNFAVNYEENKRKFGQTQYLIIGGEPMQVELCINDNSDPSGYNFVLKERGVCGAEIKKHEPGAEVYLAMHFENCHIVDVVKRLLVECSSINQFASLCCDDEQYSIVDNDSFEAYRCRNPLQYISFVLIPKPESLRKLLNQLEFLFGFSLESDSECGNVVMNDSCGLPNFTNKVIYCSEIENVSMAYGKEFQKITINHSPIDCSKSPEGDNLGAVDIFLTDDAAREACARKESRSIKEETISTSWVSAENMFAVKVSMDRQLLKHRCKPRYPRIRVSNEVAQDIYEDQAIKVEHPTIQNEFGEPDLDTWFQVLSVQPGKEYTDICLAESPYDEDTNRCLSEALIYADSGGCEFIDCPRLY